MSEFISMQKTAYILYTKHGKHSVKKERRVKLDNNLGHVYCLLTIMNKFMTDDGFFTKPQNGVYVPIVP